jgi:hypothetical protein
MILSNCAPCKKPMINDPGETGAGSHLWFSMFFKVDSHLFGPSFPFSDKFGNEFGLFG